MGSVQTVLLTRGRFQRAASIIKGISQKASCNVCFDSVWIFADRDVFLDDFHQRYYSLNDRTWLLTFNSCYATAN